MSRFINPVPQFWLDNGNVAASGLLEFYENKNYSTKKETYFDPELTIANTNPVKLDGQGRMPSCFGEGLYSVKFYAYDNAAIDKKGSLQWTRDDVDLSSGSGGAFDEWSPVQTYAIGTAVKDAGNYYRLYGSNTSKGERPSTTPSKWEKTVYITDHITGRSYSQNVVVIRNGRLYSSNTNGNTTTPPSSSWDNISFNNSVTGNFSVSGQATVGSIKTNQYFGVGSVKPSARLTPKNIASSSTFEKDTSLEIIGLEVGAYFINGSIVWSPNSASAIAGIKLRLNTDGSFFSASYTGTQNSTSTPVAPVSRNETNSSVSGIQLDPIAANINQSISFSGLIEITSAGQSVFIDWAQKTSDSLATSVVYGAITATKVS